jgi:hypothetical protein
MSMGVAQHRQSVLCLVDTLATHVFRFRYEFRVYLHWCGRGRGALMLCHQLMAQDGRNAFVGPE